MNNIKNKRIGILCGGWSSERKISLLSGKNVYGCLLKNNFNNFFLYLENNDEKILSSLIASRFSSALFNIDLIY